MIIVPGAKILDFDIENRPLSYLGSDFTTSEITAIAWGWNHDPDDKIRCAMLGEDGMDQRSILSWFRRAYDAADVVTGHFILFHDLPIINGALVEIGEPPLGPKLVSDTKVHAKIGKGISKSQESLSDILGVAAPKYHMTQAMWREANRLTPAGLGETKTRVVGDVVQHRWMRIEMIRRGYLRRPVLWNGVRS